MNLPLRYNETGTPIILHLYIFLNVGKSDKAVSPFKLAHPPYLITLVVFEGLRPPDVRLSGPLEVQTREQK